MYGEVPKPQTPNPKHQALEFQKCTVRYQTIIIAQALDVLEAWSLGNQCPAHPQH